MSSWLIQSASFHSERCQGDLTYLLCMLLDVAWCLTSTLLVLMMQCNVFQLFFAHDIWCCWQLLDIVGAEVMSHGGLAPTYSPLHLTVCLLLIINVKKTSKTAKIKKLYYYITAHHHTSMCSSIVKSVLTLSLVVRKVSPIAISLISFGYENLHIYNRVGWPDDSWFDTVCNIFNKCSSHFVRSLWKRDLTRVIWKLQ